jgi:hypothetical protein
MPLLPALISALPLCLATPGTTPSSLPASRIPQNHPPKHNPNPHPAKRAPSTPATLPPPTWDNASLTLANERFLLFGGEFHPFRLPVPSLWHDVLEKIKAAGLNTVSFHVPWALLEGEPGVFRAEGVYDLGAFFGAAREVGVWLVARPGPYIRMFLFFHFVYSFSLLLEGLCWGGGMAV